MADPPAWVAKIQHLDLSPEISSLEARQLLRKKALELMRVLNRGSPFVEYFGFKIDLLREFEKRLENLPDDQVTRILEVLRE